MCGIAGFINFKDGVALANNINCIQDHRGPDSQNVWQKQNVVLAHQRLSIIDLDSRSDQPFSKDGFVIIFNGEIYNYKEIKQNLLASDPTIQFHTTSDTEVLLELYKLKKEKCLDDIIGMFVFAVYEEDTGIVFIARDHFGIKPLYYTIIGNSFAFSSELKSLIQIPGFNKAINDNALVAVMNYLWLPGNETMFQDCHKLPAAHYLQYDTTNVNATPEIQEFWKLDTSIEYSDEDETIKALTSALEASVKRHMVADVPVSSFLSGGLDSSLLSVMASKHTDSLSTYTIATSMEDKKIEQMPEDEKYARQIANLHHFDHNEIVISADIVKELEKMVYTLDEPIGDPAAINTYLICKAAREKGVKVLLSGMGADEIFFGYRRQYAVLKASKYKSIPFFIRKLISLSVSALPVKLNGKGFKLSRWAKRFLTFADLPVEESYMRSYSYYNEEELSKLFTIDIKEHYKDLRINHKKIFNQHYQNDLVNQICYTDIHFFMQGLNLAYTDKSSMAASVEVRVPFIDKEVIQLAMQINGRLKIYNGKSKYILKKMAEKYLPNSIIYRPKASFGAPIRSWISGDLAPLVNDLLSKANVEKRAFFNYDYIEKLIKEDRKGIVDNAYRIYQLLTLELWCRRFIDS